MPYHNLSIPWIKTDMAEDKIVKKGVKDLEQEITCPVCHEHYTDPKVLPCCHYYCKQCIHHIALRTGTDKPFPCPECRKDTTLPEASVDNLPTAFFVNRMKEVHSKLELAHGKVEAKCEICREDTAEAFCRQCIKFICAECVKQHQRMKVLFPGHKVSTLDELKEGGAEEIAIQEPSHETCKAHDQPMNMYCYDCNILICRDCTIKDHRDHNYEFVKKAAPEIRKMLLQQLDPVEKVQTGRSRAVKEIQSTISDLEEQGGSVADSIKSWGDKMRAIIDTHQQELLAEAATKVQQKVKHLSDQEKNLSTEYAYSQSMIEYTKQCLEHSTNGEVMCMHAEIQSKINRDKQEQQTGLEPVEEADIGVEMSSTEDLKQLCHTVAKISQLPIKCVATGIEAKYDTISEIQLAIQLSNGKPTRRPGVVKCRLKSLARDSFTNCAVKLIKVNEYHIHYKPSFRGRHELIVTVNGQEVAGSPFPVFVSIHPTQLGKPVQVISGLNQPLFPAITPAGNILVTQRTNIAVFTENGRVDLRQPRQSKYAFSNLKDVAVDSTDGCIYVTSVNFSKIIKLSPDFERMQVFDSKLMLNFRGVEIVGDEVMVCCRDSHVRVFTKELEYKRKIGSHGDGRKQFGGIVGISSDEHNNLYVVDCDKSCVDVFSCQGKFLRSFHSDRNGVRILKAPQDVCVFGQYVYVTGFSTKCVSVFTTRGEYVTSFGDLIDFRPVGVAVDKDGYLYVVAGNGSDMMLLF